MTGLVAEKFLLKFVWGSKPAYEETGGTLNKPAMILHKHEIQIDENEAQASDDLKR
jgi:hypothetical protein